MTLLHLGFDEKKLYELGANFTAREIEGQPQLWLRTWEHLCQKKRDIQNFFQAIPRDNLRIVLTGAGTSAFIGDVLQGPFQKKTSITTHAVSTTDLVTHPDLFLLPDKPILLISFARSGNSPESVEAFNVVNKICSPVYHLIITCNPQGQLAQNACGENCFNFMTPPEADDKGLAMTGSFTSMLLAGILVAQIDKIESFEQQIKTLSQYGKRILNHYLEDIKKAASLDFKRTVFLGSGPFRGIARESHLKVQELTDGEIICKYDSFLGFRHGPKAVINKKTLIVYLFTNNSHANKYELDLVNAVNAGEKGIFRIGVMETNIDDIELDLKIILAEKNQKLAEEFLAICSVLPAQMIGMFKSINLGLKPDEPSKSGTITRVVEGVHIYPY
jgi:tagatose-6-phosphate ketose/aldose isomerase